MKFVDVIDPESGEIDKANEEVAEQEVNKLFTLNEKLKAESIELAKLIKLDIRKHRKIEKLK